MEAVDHNEVIYEHLSKNLLTEADCVTLQNGLTWCNILAGNVIASYCVKL